MEAQEVGDMLRAMLVLTLKISTPLLLTALVVGVLISLVQALIQVQEQTLTFVPKLFAIFLCLVLSAGFMTNSLLDFSKLLFEKIVK